MSNGSETLDRIARSGEAVFATDSADRLILWNRKCEALLGRPARKVLGRKCYEVLGGHDVNDNLYCHRSCPVAFQARERRQEPVNRFILRVEVEGERRRFWVSMYAIPSYHPALSTIVHVLRSAAEESELDKQLAGEAEVRVPLWPMASGTGAPADLTKREQEILRCLAEGLSTNAIAASLAISPTTVRNHVSSLLRKLDVHTKLAAVVYARQRRLI